jgi:hypothetical protein
MHVARRSWGIVAVGLFLTIISTATAKYSGGTGEPNDPYRIATAADLIALGNEPNDYGKHFILTADIDLDPNLPGRKVFNKAVIAPDADPTIEYFQGIPFTGVFDGNRHAISHLTITGVSYLGLFGQLAWGAQVKSLGVVGVNVIGSGGPVGGLAGWSFGQTVTESYTTGAVSGKDCVGGLVGDNGGTVTQCYSAGTVNGKDHVGGLVGSNYVDEFSYGVVAQCYSTGRVSGNESVGGLVGSNGGDVMWSYSAGSVSGHSYYAGGLVGQNSGVVTQCYSTGAVSGDDGVGGLVGSNDDGSVTQCYSTGSVSGTLHVGGLVGTNYRGAATACFWDMQTSGQTWSASGTSKTTAEMQTAKTFLDAGWDFVGETANGTEDIWWIKEGKDYPHLWWEMLQDEEVGPVEN